MATRLIRLKCTPQDHATICAVLSLCGPDEWPTTTADHPNGPDCARDAEEVNAETIASICQDKLDAIRIAMKNGAKP
jgi:hypothetical protein